MKVTYTDIYDFVTRQESAMLQPIPVEEGYEWSFRDHVKESILYKNSQLVAGKNKGQLDERPVKNIILPILRLEYRTEGFDVKDIELFVDDTKNYYKSFLVKKYHTRWARENGLDTFIDQLVESYVDFGGALVKKVNGARPEVIPLASVAFCDQTDLLSGPFAIKHYLSPSQLKEMEKQGWGSEANGATISVDDLILLSDDTKTPDKNTGQKTKTPGNYIELYEIHGNLPDKFLSDSSESDYSYSPQVHICGFYTDSNGEKQGVSLYSKAEPELPFKLILRDPIYGRGLGLGGIEELIDPQVWVNYSQIRIKEMLDAAAKIVHVSDDPNFVGRNTNINEIENNQVLEIGSGSTIRQLDNSPRNMVAFENWNKEMENHAQMVGAAFDPLLGAPSPAGTPFRSQNQQVIEGKGIHDYRRGQIATFVDEIYRDWIMPYFSREISKGISFLADLDSDELQNIGEQIAENQANRQRNEQVLNGELPSDKEALKQQILQSFLKGGNKKFIQIFKDDFKDAPLSVRLNVSGKQAYLSQMVDRLTGVIQTLFNPQVLQALQANPALGKPFNDILEHSGLSPIQFSGLMKMGEAPTQSIPQLQPQPVLPQGRQPVLTPQ